MRKLLNTLYVTTQKAYLSRERESVVISVAREVVMRLPLHTLDGIVCFGNVACSPFLLGACAERGVSVSFLSNNGRFLAAVRGPVSGNVLLRRQQYRMADDESSATSIARSCLTGKVANSRVVINRYLRDHQDNESDSMRAAANRLKYHLEKMKGIQPLDQLRGIEGDCAREYFSVFDNLITLQKNDFKFSERSRRPPLDNVNAMLSFAYTLLAHDVVSAIETVGLDPAVGFLHRDRPGRGSLALDIMEELRPVVADRLVLSLINLRKVVPSGFRKTESGAVQMNDVTRKKLIMAYQERKKSEIKHLFINEVIPVGQIPFVQAMLLARHIRGDLEIYPPFIWR